MTDRNDALTDHSAALPSRRAVLLGAGALGAAGLLAACGDDPPANPEAPQEAGTTAPPATTGPESTPGEEPVAGDITMAQVPVGGGVIVQGKNVIVTQPTAGEFLAFSSTCTHMACQIASVVNDKINCSCHNSQFSIADGSVLRGPATEPLPPRGVTVNGDQLIIG